MTHSTAAAPADATNTPAGSVAPPDTVLTTGSIAKLLGAELLGPDSIPILGAAALDDAEPGTITFIRSTKFASRWATSRASAALVSRGVAVPGHDPAARALLGVQNADLAMVDLLRLLAPPSIRPAPGIHPMALVDPTARLGKDVHVGPCSTIGPGTTVGDGAVIEAQVYVGAEVKIGARTRLHPGVRVLDRCVLGQDCELWPNVVIGADGFGYVPSADGSGLLKVPHLGTVIIGDRVEIGASTSIDRAKFGATTVGDGTKIDNHCQIAHNCTIGRSVIICGMTGIAGSVSIGDGAVVAGHVGIADNLAIGSRAVIAAKSGIICDIPAGETWFGTPAGPHGSQMRSFAVFKKLPDLVRRLERLERAAGEGQRPGSEK